MSASDKPLSRREVVLTAGAAALVTAARNAVAQAPEAQKPRVEPGDLPHRAVETLGGATAPFRMVDGVKEFHLVAEPISHEIAPGCVIKCWGYNGKTPGPTIEAVEGDRVRILVTNKLGEDTTIHWHGLLVPNGMAGVGGVTQPHIRPGETWVYELTLRQHGTFMYHPHADETVQMACGMMGLFVVHPKAPEKVDRDFAILLHEWAVHPGSYRPDPAVMSDFNIFTFNGKVFPAIPPLVVKTGERVRLRLGNLGMNDHPIHLHGASFRVTATDGGPVPASAQFPETTVLVPAGATRDIAWTATLPGDWPLHGHKSRHGKDAMAHAIPNVLGADQRKAERRIQKHLPEYVAMGEGGSSSTPRADIRVPKNTLPMMGSKGPFGNIAMGGMFTLVKVRDGISSYDDPGWYDHPQGTRAHELGGDHADER